MKNNNHLRDTARYRRNKVFGLRLRGSWSGGHETRRKRGVGINQGGRRVHQADFLERGFGRVRCKQGYTDQIGGHVREWVRWVVKGGGGVEIG